MVVVVVVVQQTVVKCKASRSLSPVCLTAAEIVTHTVHSERAAIPQTLLTAFTIPPRPQQATGNQFRLQKLFLIQADSISNTQHVLANVQFKQSFSARTTVHVSLHQFTKR
jgi:hypothetical protein